MATVDRRIERADVVVFVANIGARDIAAVRQHRTENKLVSTVVLVGVHR